MPTRLTPQELARGAELISDPQNQPEAIQKRYLQGKITLKEKMEALRGYGLIQKELAIAEGDYSAQKKTGEVSKLGGGTKPGQGAIGEAKYWAASVIQGYQKAWDADKEGKHSVAILRGLMASLEVLNGLNVPGDAVEREALNAGVSPGLARAANWAVWTVANFGGLSTLAKGITTPAGATIRGYRSLKSGVAGQYLKDPMGYIAQTSKAMDSKVVKEAMESATKSAAEVAGVKAAGAALPKGVKGATGADVAAHIETPQDLEQVTLQSLLNYYDERATKMVRSGVSHAQTEKTANLRPESISSILSRGPDAPISASDVERIGRVHDDVSKAFETVFEEAFSRADDIGKGAAPELKKALQTHLLAMDITNPAFLGARAQSGLTLEYWKTQQALVGKSITWDNVLKSLAADVIHEGDDKTVAKAVESLGLMHKESRQAFLAKAAEDKHGPRTLNTLYKNLLFLSPSTHVVNTSGTVASVTGKVATDYLSAFTPGGPALREVNAEVGGVLNSLMHLPGIMEKAVKKSGQNLDKYGLGGVDNTLARFGTGRMMAIEDEIPGMVLEAGLVQGEAMKRVMKLFPNATKAVQKTLVNDMIKDPDQLVDIVKMVAPDVQDVLYHAPLSKWGEHLAKGIREGPLDWYMPIIKFPVNSLKAARDWTPGLQMFSYRWADEVAAGGAKAAQANTRMALSWMQAQLMWNGTKAGLITGGGPTNPALREEWLKNHTPYSINGYPLRWFEPFSTTLFAAADMAEISNELNPDDVKDFAGALTTTLGRAIENNWWLRTMDSVTGVMSGTKRLAFSVMGKPESEAAAEAEPSPAQAKYDQVVLEANKLISSPGVTFLTGGTVGAKIRENLDPEIKDIRTWADYYKSKVPGYSDNVRPRLNWSGKPELIPSTIGSRWLNLVLPAVRPKQGDEDPVANFMTKHEIVHDDEWKSNNGTYLSGDESHDWKSIALTQAKDFNGNTWQQAIDALEADPEFQAKPRAKKQEQFNRTYRRFREIGWKGIKNLSPEIAAREIEMKNLKREAGGKERIDFGVQNEPEPTPAPEVDVEYIPPSATETVEVQ